MRAKIKNAIAGRVHGFSGAAFEHVGSQILSFPPSQTQNEVDIVHWREQQTQDRDSASTRLPGNLRDNSQHQADDDSRDTRQLSPLKERGSKCAETAQTDSTPKMENQNDRHSCLRKDRPAQDQTHDDPAWTIDQDHRQLIRDDPCRLWLPSLRIRHHAVEQLRHASLALHCDEAGELIGDADNANEEGHGNDVDYTGHEAYADLIATLCWCQGCVWVFGDLVWKRIWIDGGILSCNGEVDRVLERQRVNLDVVLVGIGHDFRL